MLKSRSTRKKRNEPDGFVVCDIENDRDGRVLDIDTCWLENGEVQHFTCQTWAQWWDWLKPKARENPLFRRIYAHNGGGWDWVSLLHWYTNNINDEKDAVEVALAGGGIVSVTLQTGSSRKEHIQLLDSLRLFQTSLDKLGTAFLGQGKIDLGTFHDKRKKLPVDIKAENPGLYYDYLRRDTETLLFVLVKALDTVREHVCPIRRFGVTIAATAMKVFREGFLDRDVMIPWGERVKSLLREGYSGGRVECFQPGEYDHVFVYDVNSLYPSVMQDTPVPISGVPYWTGEYRGDLPGCWRVAFRQTDTDRLPVLMVNGKRSYEGVGVYFSPELNLLLEVGGQIEVIEGFYFPRSAVLFREFVDRLYDLRLTDKSGPVGIVCKYLMNSLYGKFGQKAVRRKVVCAPWQEIKKLVFEGKSNYTLLDPQRSLWMVEESSRCGFEHVGIAGIITSEARARLYRGFDHVDGHAHVLYCDTDSIHSRVPMESALVDATKLGRYKLEFEGKGIYCGKKLYCLFDAVRGEAKTKAKGVRIGGDNGGRMRVEHYRRLLDTSNRPKGKRRVWFKAAITPREMFRGQSPCRFVRRKRTLRQT